ncbi:MAG TPA: LysR family substrate-binding domain-containing protein [Microlunatus sp.]|nr:LysR family substrate-binding domain-containing protein [Microlunatus sp.]
MSDLTLRVGFVPGVIPDKWARSWRERRGRTRLRLLPLEERAAEAGVRSGDLDMALVRLPVERDGLHLVRLYEEVPVVVVARDHPIAAFDEIDLADLAGEQLIGGPPAELAATVEQLDFPPMTARESVETVAAGTGVVVLPMSVARLHHRRDVVHRPVRGLPPTTIALIWRVERDDELTQAFVGVVRGRTPRSSRG